MSKEQQEDQPITEPFTEGEYDYKNLANQKELNLILLTCTTASSTTPSTSTTCPGLNCSSGQYSLYRYTSSTATLSKVTGNSSNCPNLIEVLDSEKKNMLDTIVTFDEHRLFYVCCDSVQEEP